MQKLNLKAGGIKGQKDDHQHAITYILLFPCCWALLSLLSTPPPLSMLGSMFGVDSDMSLRQLTTGSPWAGGAWILEARWIRMEEQIGSLPRRDFGANQLKTTSRSTDSDASLSNAPDPVLSRLSV